MTPFDFLNELWQYKPDDQYILIWTGADKRSRWFLQIAEAAEFASSAKGDVYTGVGLARKDYGPPPLFSTGGAVISASWMT